MSASHLTIKFYSICNDSVWKFICALKGDKMPHRGAEQEFRNLV